MVRAGVGRLVQEKGLVFAMNLREERAWLPLGYERRPGLLEVREREKERVAEVNVSEVS